MDNGFGIKKYTCIKCKLIFKSHNNTTGSGVCPGCEAQLAKDTQEALELVGQLIPERLLYLFYPKETAQIRIDDAV